MTKTNLIALKKKIDNLTKNVNQLYELATRDEKTNLYNFRFFKDIFSFELEKARRGKSLSLLIADIDNFKKLNDKYGHVFGDKILKNIAKLLQKKVRKYDLVARYGGEEFLVMLPNTNLKLVKKVAERLRRNVEKENTRHKVTISIGICEYKTADNLSSMIKHADKKLYGAKKFGRNRVCF